MAAGDATASRIRVYCGVCRNEMTVTEREVDSASKPLVTKALTVSPCWACLEKQREELDALFMNTPGPVRLGDIL